MRAIRFLALALCGVLVALGLSCGKRRIYEPVVVNQTVTDTVYVPQPGDSCDVNKKHPRHDRKWLERASRRAAEKADRETGLISF
jgi:hypothetical protein